MKKTLALILTILIIFVCCTACNGGETNTEKINIGVMSGPTGMGMAKLISDNQGESEKYSFKVFSAPTDATAELASGALDMLCLPTNLAANLSNKQSGYISVAAINCLGSLYVLSKTTISITSIDDLEGKTIHFGEPTSTTGPILRYVLEKNNVSANIIEEPSMDIVQAKMVSGEADIVVLPEPKATLAKIASAQNNNNYSVCLNLSTEWSDISDTPLTMGCIVVRNDYLIMNKASVDNFLNEYKASIEYIADTNNSESAAQMIVNAGILPKLAVAKSALSNLYGSIVYIDGANMKSALTGFYSAINIKQPESSFYYEK